MTRVQFKVRGRLTRAQRGSSGEAAADTRTFQHTQKALREFLLLGKIEIWFHQRDAEAPGTNELDFLRVTVRP